MAIIIKNRKKMTNDIKGYIAIPSIVDRCCLMNFNIIVGVK